MFFLRLQLWTVTENNGSRFAAAEMHFMGSVTGILLWDVKNNEDIGKKLQINSSTHWISDYINYRNTLSVKMKEFKKLIFQT